MTERVAALDLELIARLRAAVPVPLVLHGSSGVPDDTIVRGIRSGLTKINVSTHLNGAFTGAIREYLAQHPSAVDSRKYLAAGRDAVRLEAGRLLRLFASARPGERDRMNRAERLSAVLDLLAENGQVEVDQIVDRLDVSPATARRDLDALASQQLLTRTRGGAVAHSVAYDLPIRYKNQQHPDCEGGDRTGGERPRATRRGDRPLRRHDRRPRSSRHSSPAPTSWSPRPIPASPS